MATKCVCIEKFRDKNNIIKGYRLQDKNGNKIDTTPEVLKAAIFSGQLDVENLKLTADGKLIDNKEFKKGTKNNTKETDTIKDIESLKLLVNYFYKHGVPINSRYIYDSLRQIKPIVEGLNQSFGINVNIIEIINNRYCCCYGPFVFNPDNHYMITSSLKVTNYIKHYNKLYKNGIHDGYNILPRYKIEENLVNTIKLMMFNSKDKISIYEIYSSVKDIMNLMIDNERRFTDIGGLEIVTKRDSDTIELILRYNEYRSEYTAFLDIVKVFIKYIPERDEYEIVMKNLQDINIENNYGSKKINISKYNHNVNIMKAKDITNYTEFKNNKIKNICREGLDTLYDILPGAKDEWR